MNSCTKKQLYKRAAVQKQQLYVYYWAGRHCTHTARYPDSKLSKEVICSLSYYTNTPFDSVRPAYNHAIDHNLWGQQAMDHNLQV